MLLPRRNSRRGSEFYGPEQHNGDFFTIVVSPYFPPLFGLTADKKQQQYNLSNYIFDMEAAKDFDEYYAVYGYDGSPAAPNATSAFKASDIVLLSDALCASACALFMNMMHSEAGVKTVVAGGYPYANLYFLNTECANLES